MRLKNRIWEESDKKGIIGLITFILFFLSFFLSQARAQIEAQGSTAETQIAQIEVKYAQLAEQDRAKKILSTRTAHDKKYNIRTHTEIGIREFFNAMSEVYSLEEIQRGLSELFDKPNRATGKPYSFDQKALNLNEILYGQSDRMTWREEAVLIWFQSKHGIDEHGDGGPKTWAKLRELQKERELAQLQTVSREIIQPLPPKVEVPETPAPPPKVEEPQLEAKIPSPPALPAPVPPPAITRVPVTPLSKTELVAATVETLDTIITDNATVLNQLTARLAQPEYTPNLEELSRVRRMLHEQEQLLRDLRSQTRRARDYEEAAGQRDQERLQKTIAGVQEDIKTRERSIFEAYQVLIRAEDRRRQASAGP